MKRLLIRLGSLGKDSLVDVWSRADPVSDDRRSEIDAAPAAASFAMLLVSMDFSNSLLIREAEPPSLLTAFHACGRQMTTLLPVRASSSPTWPQVLAGWAHWPEVPCRWCELSGWSGPPLLIAGGGACVVRV